MGTGEVHGYLFYDLKREKEEKDLFYKRLHDIGEHLKHRQLRSWEKNKAVAQRVNRMGFTVILYRGSFDREDILSWTRERDVIEKMFMRLKNDIKATPMRAQKTEVAKGCLSPNDRVSVDDVGGGTARVTRL